MHNLKTMKRLITFLLLFFFVIGANLSFAQKKVLDSLLNLVQTTSVDTLKVLAMDELCFHYRYTDPIKALEFGKKSLDLARKINYHNGISRATSDLGTIFSIRGEFDSSLYYYRESLKVREKIGDKKYIANALSNIGYVFDYNAIYDSALTYHLKALKIREEMGDEMQIALSYSNIGIIYFRLTNYELANEYYNKALNIRKRLGDSVGMASLHFKIAENYFEKATEYKNVLAKLQLDSGLIKDRDNVIFTDSLKALYDKSLYYAEAAYPVFERIKDIRNLSVVLVTFGNIYGSRRDFDKALEYYKEALVYQEKMGDIVGKMKSLHNIGNIYNVTKEPKKAIKHYEESVEIAKETDDVEWELANYKHLSSAYEQLKRYDEALNIYRKYAELKQEIFKGTMSEQIAEMQTKYETEKKEGQIKLMQKEQDMMKQEQEAQRARQRLYLIGGLIFISLLLIIVFIISRAYRQKKKANSLLKAQKEQILEQNEALIQQKEEIIAQRDEIEQQRNLIEEKNKHITDSIRYAMRIQQAILPSNEFIKQRLKDFFVLFLPKDIVSGDFYWVDDAPDGGNIFCGC